MQLTHRFAAVTTLLIGVCAGVTPAALGGTAELNGPDGEEPASLTFTAAPGEANHLILIDGAGGYRLFDFGASLTAGPGCSQVDANEVFCAFNPDLGGALIEVLLGDQDDRASVATGFGAPFVSGEGGDDEIESGGHCAIEDCQPAHLFGGAGADTLTGDRASLDGGPDGDILSGPESTAVYVSRTAPVNVSADGLANDGEVGEGDNVETPWVVGGSGNDTFTEINASGRGGNDTFIAGSGPMLAYGDAGDDMFFGGAGGDGFVGGPGDDELHGGGGGDDLVGDGGADVLRGDEGGDYLSGGRGNDTLAGGTGRDLFLGGAGRDVLRARDGVRERLAGGAGFDRARIDPGLDVARSIEAFF